jgi:hypothetical protein
LRRPSARRPSMMIATTKSSRRTATSLAVWIGIYK